MNRRAVLIVLGLSGVPTIASAGQRHETPPAELGGSAGLFAALYADGVAPRLSGGPRLSVNITDRLGADFILEFVGPLESAGLFGAYHLQIRQVVRAAAPGRGTVFVTAGAAGGFRYHRVSERRELRRDGSVVVYRAQTQAALTKPSAFSAGIGVQRPIAKYLAFRAEAQALVGLAIAVRGSLGVSVPLGGRYVVR